MQLYDIISSLIFIRCIRPLHMKSIIFVYPIKISFISIALITLLLLNGCSSPPKQYSSPSEQTQTERYVPKVLTKQPPAQIKAEDLTSLSQAELEQQMLTAHQQAEWPNFILLNQQLWQYASKTEQAQIEQRIWEAISQQPLPAIKQTIPILKQHPNSTVQQWGALLAILKGPAETLQKNLKQLTTTYPNAMFTHHLLPGIIMQIQQVNTPKNIAVLLPFEGKYTHIANQIKQGIMKAFMASDQSVQLSFHDTADLDHLEILYSQLKQNGIDFIIGPLRKQAIDHLISVADANVLALNRIDYAPFIQFSYKSANEVSQLIRQFENKQYQTIGILSNDSRADTKLAHTLKKEWERNPGHQATLSFYPDKKPNFREAVSTLINANKSNDRYHTLRWAIGQNSTFFPRSRQDFDAIVIIDNATRVAVLKPQFAFFNLNTPIYGTAQLTPSKLQAIQPNRDLAGIRFLTHPVIFQPKTLASNFEAFGWDSFQVVTLLPSLTIGGYLSQGKTGELTLSDQLIQQRLVWASYNSKGQLVPLKTP